MSDFDWKEAVAEECPVPLLQNNSSLTEDGIKEALTAFLRTPSWILVRLLFAVMAGVGIFMLIRGFNNGMEMQSILSGAVLVVFSLAMYIHRFLMYPVKTAEKIVKKKKEQLKAQELHTEYRFFDENIISLMNGEETAEIIYDSIRRVYRTQNYIILSTFNRKMLLLSPDGFEYGDEQDFLEYMKEKCPKALPKKKEK